jgi:hypothetical protein
MAYGEDSQVKTDLGITGTAFDARLSDWNDKASEQWDDILYETAAKRRLITALPELPLQTSEVTETDKDGTNYLMKARYFDNQKQKEVADGFRKVAEGLAKTRIKRLATDKQYYGLIIR